MSSHAHLYCKTLGNVTKAELVNALHQAFIQLRANGLSPYSERLGTNLDNAPTIAEASRVLALCGHIGFTP